MLDSLIDGLLEALVDFHRAEVTPVHEAVPVEDNSATRLSAALHTACIAEPAVPDQCPQPTPNGCEAPQKSRLHNTPDAAPMDYG